MIVDDHPVVRNGLEAMLSIEDDLEVVAAAGGGDEAVAWCKAHAQGPDVVVSDVHMPRGDGFAMLGALRNACPKTRVLLLAGMPLKDEETRARADGAAGYLPKSIEGRRLISAIRRVADVTADFVSGDFNQNTGILSDKELTVLQYASAGKTRDEIAIILDISSETVKSHLRAIMRKLDTTNTTASVARAFSLGLLRV
ncbi:MAG: response regulator [Kiritimatiellia bacterium]